jgi:hypothetical protein
VSLQIVDPLVIGKYGGPLTTTFGPASTTEALVADTTNFWPSIRTKRAEGEAHTLATNTRATASRAYIVGIRLARIFYVGKNGRWLIRIRGPGYVSTFMKEAKKSDFGAKMRFDEGDER